MATPEEMRITVTTNGPYRVTGSVPLVPRTIVTDEEGFSVEWGEGEPFTTEADVRAVSVRRYEDRALL